MSHVETTTATEPPQMTQDASEQEKPTKTALVRTKRRKLNDHDLKAMADLAAMRLNDLESCAVLGISINQWTRWLNRRKNKDNFDLEVARLRGNGIKMSMETLLEAGKRENPKTLQIDWRAHDKYLERLDRERFGPPSNNVQVNVGIALPENLLERAREVFKMRSVKQAEVADSGLTPKLLTDEVKANER